MRLDDVSRRAGSLCASRQIATTGYSYDGAGNLLTTNTLMPKMVYDAENRLTCVQGTDGTCTSSTAMLYFYDASGQRVGKQQANGRGENGVRGRTVSGTVVLSEETVIGRGHGKGEAGDVGGG